MLTVYKASAGSGKTFRLVLEYLKLMLTRKNYYRHILAVTFTNKATAEMKERIVEQLGNMAANRETPYLEILASETGLAENELRLRASEALKSLLFDFNRFSVSTIDKFTQQVLKSFNREIGVNPYYQLETDTDMLISEAVDRLIAGIANNKSLREWLESYIAEKIRNNRSFEFEREIRDLGKELFKEKLQGKFSLLSDFSSDRVKAAEYLKMLEQIIFSFEANWKRRATDIVKAYKAAGYTSDDFAGKGRGIGAYLEKAVSGEVDVLKNYVTKAAESPEGWLTKIAIKNTALLQLVSERLWPMLQEMVALHTDNWRKYCTAKAISREWYTASILVDLNNEVAALSREKGVLPLAGSNLLLKAVIDGNDAPFIYEKVGNRYFSFMLDEFQDTSEMQWENFRPLVTNSMASGYANLVVGDIKQSIYRWRNSSWNLLEEQIFRDFRKDQINDKPLTVNHRSASEIIQFNNSLFSELLVSMVSTEKLKPYAEQFTARLQNIYRDLTQEVSPRSAGKGGYVCIDQLESDEEDFGEMSLNRLAAQVRTLYDNGFSASDIVILVRGKREGVRIVDHFLEIAGEDENLPYNFQIISGESLFLVSSPAVNFIVQLFRYLEDRENLLIQTVLLHLHRNFISPALLKLDGVETEQEIDASAFENSGLFEAELEPIISTLGQQMSTGSLDEAIIRICSAFRLFEIPSELPYLQSLIDQVAELKKKMISDIPGFLEWWDETGFEVSVNVNETTDAIRLMTIHKAKGLEFRAVLIPFFNWRTTGNGRKNIIWCEPCEAPFNAAPLVPVNFSDQLSETIFSDDWLQESFNVIVDNINLIYVAFTRAESVLWVNLPAKGKPAGIESYLAKALESLSQHPGFEQKEEEGHQRFTYGTLPVIIKKGVSLEVPNAIRWHFREFSGRLKLKVTEEDFLAKSENGMTRKNFGIVLHDLLSGISKATDIGPSVKRAEAAGMIPQSAAKEVLDHLLRMAEHPVAKDWFSGSWKVLNEADLLTLQDTWRPDRIMIKGNSAVVVDFKTGLQKRESHKRQVRNYARLLCESGFNQVTGYLWYMNSDEPELVATHC